MSNLRYLVVIPSGYVFDLSILDEVSNVDIMIVDDTETVVHRPPPPHHFAKVIYANSTFREMYLGTPSTVRSLIPVNSPSVVNFGMYYAWVESYDVVVFLYQHSDTNITPGFIDQIPIGKRIYQSKILDTPSGWMNTIYPISMEVSDDIVELFPRGYPYEHRDDRAKISDLSGVTVSHFNQGLWTGNLDINAIDKTQLGSNLKNWQIPPMPLNLGVYKLRLGQKLPLSMINAQIGRDLIPAFYQPSRYGVGNLGLRWHEDLWSSAFLKIIMDYFEYDMTFGDPVIYNMYEGNPMVGIQNEYLSNLFHPWVIRVLEEAQNWLVPSYAGINVTVASESMFLAMAIQNSLTQVRPPGAIYRVLYHWASCAYNWAQLFLV